LTWCDLAGVRLKLKVTATQRHCRESPVLASYLTSSVSFWTDHVCMYVCAMESKSVYLTAVRCQCASCTFAYPSLACVVILS
jgi:hypothetical protein